MQISLSDQQLSGAKATEAWFAEARNNLAVFEAARGASQEYLSNGQTFVFAGYAGSGKSTSVAAVIERLGLGPDNVMYMAPTGKAAKVLTSKLRQAGWNTPATTVHKAIYIPKGQKASQIRKEMNLIESHILFEKSGGEAGTFLEPSIYPLISGQPFDVLEKRLRELDNELRDAMKNDGPSFNLKHKDDIPAGIELFVVDEASMVGSELAGDLASFGLPILAIGDPGQLPPVADVWGFNMQDPDVFLDEIHRQASDNPILYLAARARNGEELKIGDYGNDVKVVNRRDDDVTYNMDRDAVVLVGTHKKKWNITGKIRKSLGYDETGPMEGEPLLVCKNSRVYPELVNGTILRCDKNIGNLKNGSAAIFLRAIDDDDGGRIYDINCTQGLFEEHYFKRRGAYSAAARDAFQANLRCEHADWGHALTVHKAQGSEFPDVVVHDESGVFREQASAWLYTGITRSSDKLTVVV